MRSIIGFLSVITVALFALSCGSKPDKLSGEIKTLEDSLFSDATKMIDKKLAQELITRYIEFADVFPEHGETPAILFKAGDMAMNLNMAQQAIDLFDRIMDDYPSYEKAPQCLFLKGYIYENDFRDLETARKIYEEFLDKYPNDEFADDAEISIKNLGKTPEELIREFEEKAALENKD
jgi:outer membrane protein assembly factor BamD (BamD/ComL family)